MCLALVLGVQRVERWAYQRARWRRQEKQSENLLMQKFTWERPRVLGVFKQGRGYVYVWGDAFVEVFGVWQGKVFPYPWVLGMEFKPSSLGNVISWKAFMPGNHGPAGALGTMNLAGVFRVAAGCGAGGGGPEWNLLWVLLLVVMLLCQSPLHAVEAAHSYKNVLTQEV